MLYILLDIGMPAASWLGVATAIVMTILGFTVKKIIENVEGDVKEARDDNKLLKGEVRKIDDKLNDVSKQVDTKITDLNLNILDKLNDIKDKFYDLRK